MKSAEDLISVVVPIYNVAEYLNECIDSILAQDYKTIEVILVDDGSTDDSKKICKEYAKKYSFVHVIHQKNAGLSAARNRGLSVAKGEYICFVDSDDYLLPGYLSELLKAAKKNNASISVCGYGDIVPAEKTISGEEATIQFLTKQENIDILAWNKLYRLSIFKNYDITYPEGKKNEDNLTTYKLYTHANSVTYIAKSLYYYRERENSITKTINEVERLKMRELAAKEAQQYLRGNYILKKAAAVALLTAKFAFIDKAIAGKIDRNYLSLARNWILEHKSEYKDNEFVNKKLKLYFVLLSKMGGKPYIAFRKIKHE